MPLPSLKFRPTFAPIQGFVGMNGSGKSALSQYTAFEVAKANNVAVYSNITLTHETVETHRIRGIEQVLELEHCVVLLDDVSAILNARETGGLSPEFVTRMLSLRHQDKVLLWSSPTMSDADIKLRQVTQKVVAMNSLITRKRDGQLWRDTMYSIGREYNTSGEMVTAVNRDTPLIGYGLVRLSDLGLHHYDTHEHLEFMVDHAICPDCGLRKRREYCNGKHPKAATPDKESEMLPASVAEPLQVTAAGAI